MNVSVTTDVLMAFGMLSLLIERMWKILSELKNGKNGNGNGKYVTYNDLMRHSTGCAGEIHKKFDAYHADVMRVLSLHGERISAIESMFSKN